MPLNEIDSDSSFNYEFPDRKLSNETFFKNPVSKIKGCYGKNSPGTWDDNSPTDDETTSSNEGSKHDSQLPHIIKWRRAITKDKPAIKQLQTLNSEVANLLFRKRDIDELIEKSCFPIVQIDSKGKLVSFTAYDPYPNIPSIPSFTGNEWLSTTYRIHNAHSGNVLFVHYMVWQPQQAHKFLRLLLEASFSEFVHLKHIIIVKPPRTDIPDIYTEYFIPVLPSTLETLNFDSIQTLLVCLRTSIIRPLPIRIALWFSFSMTDGRNKIVNKYLAEGKFINNIYNFSTLFFREEDFDLIMPVINRHTNSDALHASLETNIDNFRFVYHKEKRPLICEFEGVMTGLMILNLEIDVDSLNVNYELSPFHGLRKRDHEDEKLIEPSHTSVYKHPWWGMMERPNALISSDYLLRQLNWSLHSNKEKVAESSIVSSTSFETLSTISDFSGLSIFESLNGSQGTYSKKPSSTITAQSRHDLQPKIADIRVSVRSSITKMPYFHVPKYHGELNAFVIDFFAVDCSKINEKIASFEFLKAAFKKIPDRDYCLLIIPTHVVSFPLLDLFVRVTPRILSNHTNELYLCHKNSLLSTSIVVRSAVKEDLTAIDNFLNKVTDKDEIYQDIVDSFIVKKEYKSYVFTIEGKISGVSLINLNYVGADYFRMYFNITNYTVIELHKNENQSVIKYFIINPKYRNHARFFIRDIMRLTDLSCLYYVFNEPKKDWMNRLTILDEFVPVRPKQTAGLIEEPSSPSNVQENLYKMPFSLCLMNTKISGYSKFHINTVLVVVGASQTAFSFLESLIYGNSGLYVTYNNLIWVTPHEIDEGSEMKPKDFIFPVMDNCSGKYKSMACLRAYVNFVYGVMTEINRREKYIVVNNKVSLRYDYLILACGLQFLSPTPKAKEVQKDVHDKNFRSSLTRFLIRAEPKRLNIPRYPVNMFIINTSSDAETTLVFLEHLMRKFKYGNESDKKIVLYGHDLQLFLTLQALLKMGIPGELIVFVEPFPTDDQNFTLFNDSYVDQAVIESVKQCKVHYYTEYFLYDWSLTPDDFITTLNFHSERKQILIPCLVFLPFLEKIVSSVTFNACNNAGLVYDKRLVINHNFRTNDRYIYGAGPFTKYAGRYYASDQDHQFFSSREIGQRLADILRSKIDPTFEDRNKYEEESDLVPTMKAPILCYCQLPGDFNYLVVRKPGKLLDLETAYNISDYGEVLTTGNCQMEKGIGYFRIHLNASGCVEDITCYTKDKFDYVNLSFLYGLHEKLLNNLLLRYDLSLISDFYEYFSQPWALALFHENFRILKNCNYMIFNEPLSKISGQSFSEKLISKFVRNKWRRLPEIVKLDLEKHYKNSKIEKKIRKNIIQFIENYKEDLPVYAAPSVINDLLRGRPEI